MPNSPRSQSQFTLCVKLPSNFLLLQLTGDRNDNKATVTNKINVLSIEGKFKLIQELKNGKQES